MKTKTRIAALVCSLSLMALLPLLNSQTENGDTASKITKLINVGVKADLASDTSFIKNNYADDYVEGTSFGTWVTKEQLLDTTNNKMNSETVGDIKVNVVGNTAIARFKETYDGLVLGQHRNRTIICTQTWNKQDAGWKAVATHCSQAQ
jgi:hypothetical protein